MVEKLEVEEYKVTRFVQVERRAAGCVTRGGRLMGNNRVMGVWLTPILLIPPIPVQYSKQSR